MCSVFELQTCIILDICLRLAVCLSLSLLSQELAGELTNRQAKRERKDSVKITLIRIVTNTFVVLSLVAGGVAIWFAVDAVSWGREIIYV